MINRIKTNPSINNHSNLHPMLQKEPFFSTRLNYLWVMWSRNIFQIVGNCLQYQVFPSGSPFKYWSGEIRVRKKKKQTQKAPPPKKRKKKTFVFLVIEYNLLSAEVDLCSGRDCCGERKSVFYLVSSYSLFWVVKRRTRKSIWELWRIECFHLSINLISHMIFFLLHPNLSVTAL